jgi:branched-chain amino acid transport system permease protein
MDAPTFLISLLNGLSLGLLLFMLASGLTLIFSMMGVLNFAHASFYMLGAYVGWTVARALGFWWALVLAPPLVGALGAAFEHHLLRRVHRHGHVPELLVTFGLSYIVVELVGLLWGRQALDFPPPPALQGPLFTIVGGHGSLSLAWGGPPAACRAAAGAVCTQFPLFRAFGMGVAVAMLAALALLLARTRIGLVIRAAITHPAAVEALGHDVPRVTMLVFGGGTALAALAGVIGGVLRVTEPAMAQSVGAVVFAVIVIGGMGSLAGAFVASLGLGLIESYAIGSDRTLADLLAGLGLALGPDTPGHAVWSVKTSQVAAVLPFLLLVLMLIFRPRGLFGSRED